jgi:AraC-like DNA-binding protein
MEGQVAVTAGASRFRRLDVSLGCISANRFPPDLTLPPHSHPQATIAVILSGGFAGQYRGGERDCWARSVIVEPAGAEHANRFGRDETAILTLSLDRDRLGSGVDALVQQVIVDRDPFAELIARRAATELDRPDDVTPLAVEAAALELVARLTRTALPDRRPAWLSEARAFLHDRYADSVSLADVATAVGIEPERMARVFRRAFGEPLASYLRRIRVNVAAHLLVSTAEPISQVAADVGFTDQSHLNRWFARYVGTTPARYRAEHSRRVMPQSRTRGGP